MQGKSWLPPTIIIKYKAPRFYIKDNIITRNSTTPLLKPTRKNINIQEPNLYFPIN